MGASLLHGGWVLTVDRADTAFEALREEQLDRLGERRGLKARTPVLSSKPTECAGSIDT